jgi:glycosyltransferase involved in cell wall biosynthesis
VGRLLGAIPEGANSETTAGGCRQKLTLGDSGIVNSVERDVKLSVCMAAHNGSRYIHEQIASILPQLGKRDELIVVDDASGDNTTALIESFGDGRVRVMRNVQNVGAVRSFERAVQLASGDIIFLSDQDDIWHSDKVRAFITRFAADPTVTLVIGNGELIDADGRPLGERIYSNGSFATGVLANLLKNRYQGAAMAFRREVAEVALPFPKGIPMHDSWIGLVNAIIGKAAYLDEPLLLYRRHGSNSTVGKHGPIPRMLAQRWTLARELACRAGRLVRARRELKRKRRTVKEIRAAGY